MRKEKEAARLKAANDRAAARRLAKESLELIDDERLELMEIAASNKGLPSMLSLDSEALESLESLRGIHPLINLLFTVFKIIKAISYIFHARV